MSRTVKDWTPDRVEDIEPAPHRYLWTAMAEINPDPSAMRLSEFRKLAPYQPGDVVFIAYQANYLADPVPIRARVLHVFAMLDRYGDRRHKYRVQRATAAGLWSKSWEYTYPGPIQRGYFLAGLAPEIPPDAMK